MTLRKIDWFVRTNSKPDKHIQRVGLEVFTAVVMKSIIFWDMAPCTPLSFDRPATCLLAGLLKLFFDPEDGGDMFLRNVG
jgi:hypothetical protein